MENTQTNVQALATPAQTSETTNESTSGGCQQRFVLPCSSLKMLKERVWGFRRFRKAVALGAASAHKAMGNEKGFNSLSALAASLDE